MPLLDVKGMSVRFGDVEAVRNASFSIEPGSFTSLAGRSGSGKSVTALCLTRLLPNALISGKAELEFSGKKLDLLACDAKSLRAVRGCGISYVFQDPGSSLNPVFKIGAQIEETFRVHKGSGRSGLRSQALQILASLGMRDPERVHSSYPHQLSGGMRQRAMLAIALVSRPSLLIADEPTTALDVSTQKEMMELLAAKRKELGFSVLFITHNLSLAMKYSDKIYVMEKGGLCEAMSRGGDFKPHSPEGKRLFSASLTGLAPKSRIEIPC